MEEDFSDESEYEDLSPEDNPNQNLDEEAEYTYTIEASTEKPPQISPPTPLPARSLTTTPWSNTLIAASFQCPALEALESAVIADINTRVVYHLEQLLHTIAHDEKMSYQRLATRYLAPLKELIIAPKRPTVYIKPRITP